GDTAFAGDPKLVEDFARLGEGETGRPAERLRNVLDDAPVLPRLTRTVDGLVDLDDASFNLGHRAFVFLLKTARQHDCGVPRRVVQEEVDRGVELELVETTRDEGIVGKRHLRVEADREEPFDLSSIDLAKELIRVDARARKLLLFDAPDARHVAAVLGVADIAPARQLIAFLPMLAAALSVGLANDRAVAALRLADPSRGQDEIDGGEGVLDPI